MSAAPRSRPFWFYGAIILIGVLAAGWALVSQQYYDWVLGNTPINIIIFCDTSDLDDPDLKAAVLYDKIALTPLARALGLYQNRPPERVTVFFSKPVSQYSLTPISITLKHVPRGPITRIILIAKGKHIHVKVPHRRLFNDTLYIRVPP